MADITAALVKDLRDKTGAGMMDCKKALIEVAGDIEAAVDWLRKKGLAAAAKKSGRIASEGLVGVASAPGRAGPVGFGAVTEARFRAAEPLGVPARGVVPQVVVDVSCVAPIAPVGRRATVPSRACVAIPNVKVISFAAHASSLVARRSRLVGMRPLPEGRVPESGEPAEHKRYLLETMFTGWPVLLARSVTD